MKFGYESFINDNCVYKYTILYGKFFIFWRAREPRVLDSHEGVDWRTFMRLRGIKYFYERYGHKNEFKTCHTFDGSTPYDIGDLTEEEFRRLLSIEKFNNSFEDKLL